MATLNAAECYGLKWYGAVAPNYIANLAVVDNLKDFNVKYVFKNGSPIVQNGKTMFDASPRYKPQSVQSTVRIPALSPNDFELRLKGERAKVIKVNGGSIVTDCEIRNVKSIGGDVDLSGTDILKLAVVERHKLTGNIGLGLLTGYGFKGGAVGITVSHDSHNMIIAGDGNDAMVKIARELARVGGGMAVYDGSKDEMLSLP
ncbi:MAG: amidohydrolase family protein, partial [Clostridia bacterium]|nr:amidohydrolase family protein [Clostridia bacterium]